MLLLVVADRHLIGLIEQNISGHQHRITEQADVDVVLETGGLVLELGHARQLTHLGVAVEDPAQLGVLRHVRLDENGALLGIDTDRQIEGGRVQTSLAQGSRVLASGDGVQVDDAVEAVELILHVDPLTQGPHVVADGQLTGGLRSAQYDWFSHESVNPCYSASPAALLDQKCIELGKLLEYPVWMGVGDGAAIVVAVGKTHHLHASRLGRQHVIF